MDTRVYSIRIGKAFRRFLMILLFFSPATLVSAQTDQRTSTKKPVILVLGIYHLVGNGEDVTTPKRQKEIAEVVALLKTFQPTRIAVEALVENLKIN